MSTYYALQRQEQVEHMATAIGELVDKHGLVTVHYKTGRTRSSRQQAALEVWCRMIADMLNEQEIYRAVKSPIYKEGEMPAPWDQENVKNEIWRPVQKALTGEESTTRPTPQQYIEVQDHLIRAFGDKGVQLPPWPIRREHGGD